MVPFMMVGWTRQWYAKVPAEANVCWNVPDDLISESMVGSASKVTLCSWPFESQAQVTVPPAATENVAGLNRSFCTSMSPAGGGLLDVPPSPELSLPQPDASSTDAAQSAGISHCVRMHTSGLARRKPDDYPDLRGALPDNLGQA
jgi:hypothetical protein